MPVKSSFQSPFSVPSAQEIIPLVVSAPEVVFADIETTGFGTYCDITEIGAVRLDVKSGKIISKFSSYCHLKYQKKVPQKITELTGITTDTLTDAPRLEVVLNIFQKFIGDTPVSFHNATFDWPILGAKYLLLGRELPNQVICTKKLFSYLHPGMPANLEAVCNFYGRPIEGHHRAYMDCKWTAACYMKMRFELVELLSRQPDLLPSCSPALPASPHVNEMTYDDLTRTCSIYRITGWRKGSSVRIYCTTNIADFFYDLNDHVWNVVKKKTPNNLNVETLGKFLLDRIGLSLTQFQELYRPD